MRSRVSSASALKSWLRGLTGRTLADGCACITYAYIYICASVNGCYWELHSGQK